MMNPLQLSSTRLGRVVEAVLGLTELQRLYARLRTGDFAEQALRVLHIDVAIEGDLAAIPPAGPAVIVANHPGGAVDGLALLQMARQRRSDVKLLANQLLARIPDLRAQVIGVNPFRPSAPESVRGLREARRWLAGGGALIVFPAGEVSSATDADGQVVDRPWHAGVLALARWTAAPVVPVFVHGQNRRIFRLAGRVHPLLRTALLVRELLARRGTTLRVSVGTAVSAERLAQIREPGARLMYLRARTYALATRTVRVRSGHESAMPLAPAEPADVMAAEIAALPDRAQLLTSGPYVVYCASAHQMPSVMRELGRLRELTFRLAGEGTGRARDLDRFDRDYQHLFVWHVPSCAIVGAYRLGLTDRLSASSNPHVLYSRTLFRFGGRLLDELGPAVELGRSFVRPEYQRESNALLLLWRGIGAFVAREPRYRYLFGAVSMSAEYHSLTRQVVARFLSTGAFVSELAGLVRPRRPLALGCDAAHLVRSHVVTSLDEVERLVHELEGGRGLPVLLRQYLKLNARLLGFSVDPAFANVLDGLVLVDLLAVKPALLQRFLGRDAAAAVLAFHHPAPTPAFIRALPARSTLPVQART
jgi:putative hemolysin